MFRFRRGWLLLLVPAAFVSGGFFLAFGLWKQTRPYEGGVAADVSWRVGGVPFRIECKVAGLDGSPLPGVDVRIANSSGGSGGRTDEHGIARVEVGEGEVGGVLVNGTWLMDRPFACLLGTPVVGQGLQLTIVVKEPGLLGMPSGPDER